MAAVHPLDNTFWTDAHRYKDAEANYYSSLSKINNNPSPLNHTNKRSKKSKTKQNDPDISVHVTISQISPTQIPNPATSNIENKDTGNASGGKKKRNKHKSKSGSNAPENSLAAQVHKARQQLQDQVQNVGRCDRSSSTLLPDLVLKLEEDKISLEKTVASLIERISALELTVSKLQESKSGVPSSCPVSKKQSVPASKPSAPKSAADDDDDVDLFGSESEGEDDTAAKIREERLAAYAAKKSKKPVLIAKSNIIFDVKPWDDETDMKELEKIVRSIEQDGLLWGAAKLVPLAYGIHKLQISCVVEDDKVSVDEIQEKIEELGSEFVQSVDIAAFNKI